MKIDGSLLALNQEYELSSVSFNKFDFRHKKQEVDIVVGNDGYEYRISGQRTNSIPNPITQSLKLDSHSKIIDIFGNALGPYSRYVTRLTGPNEKKDKISMLIQSLDNKNLVHINGDEYMKDGERHFLIKKHEYFYLVTTRTVIALVLFTITIKFFYDRFYQK